MNVSILVPAHNEATNIQQLLTTLLAQKTQRAQIVEVIVVASGCTDDTAELARGVARGRPGVQVYVQERRGGKVAAINEYLRIRNPRADVVLMCSADLRVAPDVVERIVQCFFDHPEVGMVGARPVPDNDKNALVGRMVQVLWELHHRIALLHPKMGELVAFRANLIERVSELSVVDEASVEDIVRTRGYELAYVPDAVVQNHGPDKLNEYFEQRRRIARGHYWLDFAFGYQVATLDRSLLLRSVYDLWTEEDRFGKRALAAAVATEVVARAAGFFDARILGGKHRTWKQLSSTKRLRTLFPQAASKAPPEVEVPRPPPLPSEGRRP
jgi:poly-beta-1,6-N-acetyl-D-glucosamine synthase